MDTLLQISFLQLPAPWEGASIATSFPMKSAAAHAVCKMLASILFDVKRDAKPVFYANTNHMHEDDVWKQFSRNGAAWKIQSGVGVFPDDPPRLMTPNDFYSFELGKKPRSMLDPVLAVAPDSIDAARNVFETTSGYGNTTVILSALNSKALGKQMTENVLPLVKDECFRTFQLYVPLLNSRTAGWLAGSAGVEIYFRECIEEAALLIASRSPLAPALQAAGAKFDKVRKVWTLSLPASP